MSRNGFIQAALKNYRVDQMGNVYYSNRHKSIERRSKVLKTHLSHKGYPHITLSYNGQTKTVPVHRVVAIKYFGPKNLSVNHIDGNKTNNAVSNLEYLSIADNIRHYRDNSEKLGSSKLTKEEVRALKSALELGLNNKQLSLIFGISRNQVANIRNKICWSDIHPND